MRKFFKRVVGIFLAFIVLIGIAILVVVLTIDKEWIESRLQNTLSRQVSIGKLKTRLLSPISGFQVEDLKISNRLSSQELATKEEIPASRLFIQAQLGTMKLSLLPLLQRKLKIRKIVLHKPFLHLIRYRDSSYNFSDLLDDEESFFKQISIAGLTIRDGHLAFTDLKTGNRFSLNDFSLNSKEPGIASGKEKLDVMSTFNFRARRLRSSSFAKGADIVFRINGTIQSLVNPDSPTLSFDLDVHTVEGTIRNFRIMEKINSLPAIRDYLGNLSFLAKNFTWKKGSVRIGFKRGIIKLTGGEIRSQNHSLKYDGQFWPHSGRMSIKAQLLLPGQYKETIRNRLLAKINRLLPARLKNSVDQAELVERMISPIINQQGKLYLVFALKGTPSQPIVKLISPRLQQFSKVLIDLAKEKISSQGKSLLDRLVDKILHKN